MRSILKLSLLFCASILPIAGFAHPGHGLVDADNPMHYFTSEHILPLALLLVAVFVLRTFIIRKAGTSKTLNR